MATDTKAQAAAAAAVPAAAAAPAVKPMPPAAAPAAVAAPAQAHTPAAAAAPQQQQLQQQQPAAVKQSQVSPIDAVIDEVLGGDLGMQERQLLADEVAYSYFSSIREAAGDDLDSDTAAELNKLVVMSQAEKDAILQKTNRVARRVLRPLGYKVLQVQGLNPDTVSPAAARAALEAELTPQQQAVVDAEAERLFKEVYYPELQAAAADAGVQHPQEAWEQFGRDILARQPEETQQQNTAAIAVPAALAGAVVALVVSKLFGWLQRRRQRSRQELSGSEYYEEEILTASDSAQDAASAYDDE